MCVGVTVSVCVGGCDSMCVCYVLLWLLVFMLVKLTLLVFMLVKHVFNSSFMIILFFVV